MGIVVFDPARFKQRYGEFNSVNDVALGDFFTEATLYLDNTDCSIVSDLAQRTLLLNMLTAHIAAGNSCGSGGAAGLVGRISSATEGSVSVTADFYDAQNGTEAWFASTKYGAAYWAATARYRTAIYIAPCLPQYGRTARRFP